MDKFFLSLLAGNAVAYQQAIFIVTEAGTGNIARKLTQADMAEALAIVRAATNEPIEVSE